MKVRKVTILVICLLMGLSLTTLAQERVNPFLRDLALEKEGFSFGEVWKHDEKSLVAVLPILRDRDLERGYMTLKEAKKVTIKDTGKIDELLVVNDGSEPVYIRIGEIFQGATQERAAIQSYIILPDTRAIIKVRCVNRSKGINSGTDMLFYGFVPSALEVTLSDGEPNQTQVWDVVNDINLDLGIATATPNVLLDTLEDRTRGITLGTSDDLKEGLDTLTEQAKDILANMPALDNQVGMVILDKDGVVSLELFDLAQSWAALREDIVKKDSHELTKVSETSIFELKKEPMVKAVREVLTQEFTETKLDDQGLNLGGSEIYQVIRLSNEQYVGEIVELNSVVLHCTLVRREVKKGQESILGSNVTPAVAESIGFVTARIEDSPNHGTGMILREQEIAITYWETGKDVKDMIALTHDGYIRIGETRILLEGIIDKLEALFPDLVEESNKEIYHD